MFYLKETCTVSFLERHMNNFAFHPGVYGVWAYTPSAQGLTTMLNRLCCLTQDYLLCSKMEMLWVDYLHRLWSAICCMERRIHDLKSVHFAISWQRVYVWLTCPTFVDYCNIKNTADDNNFVILSKCCGWTCCGRYIFHNMYIRAKN